MTLVGLRYGTLVVVEGIIGRGQKITHYKCQCDCGNTRIVQNCKLKAGHYKYCGVKCPEKPSNKKSQKAKKFQKDKNENYYKQKVISIKSAKRKCVTLQLTDYKTFQNYNIMHNYVMHMEERYKDGKHYYTSVYIYPPLRGADGILEYKVRQTMKEINQQMSLLKVAA